MRDAAEQLEKIHHEHHPSGVPPEEKLAAFLHRHMDFIRRWPTAYALYSRGALSAEVREIWEQSKQRALRIVLRYFDIPRPTRRQLALARAWLVFRRACLGLAADIDDREGECCPNQYRYVQRSHQPVESIGWTGEAQSRTAQLWPPSYPGGLICLNLTARR